MTVVDVPQSMMSMVSRVCSAAMAAAVSDAVMAAAVPTADPVPVMTANSADITQK